MAISAQALCKWDLAPTQPVMTPLAAHLHTGYGQNISIRMTWTMYYMAVLWAVVKVNQHLMFKGCLQSQKLYSITPQLFNLKKMSE